MPAMGHFMEIEAEPDEIEKMAELLGLDLKHGMKESYMDLFEEYRRKGHLKQENWVFSEK